MVRLFLTVLVAFGLGACSSYKPDGRPAQEGAGSGGDECVHATFPRFPTVGDGGPGSYEFVVAIDQYDFGDRDDGPATRRFEAMGYDLDLTCTGLGQGPTCAKSAWATADASDGPEGRDNSYGAVVYSTSQSGEGTVTRAVNTAANIGTVTTVARVRGYNGTSSDGKVEVALYAATMNGGGTTTERPEWNGDDVWAAHLGWVDHDDSGQPSVDRPKFRT